MQRSKKTTRNAFTIIELVIASMLGVIVILGMSVVLADSQKSWGDIYQKVHSDVASDSYVVRRAFDAIIRKASGTYASLDEDGHWIEVYYYNNSASEKLDRYAYIYVSDGKLMADHGYWDADQVSKGDLISSAIMCSNVSSCKFKINGKSVQMILNLSKEGLAPATIVSSAVMHN